MRSLAPFLAVALVAVLAIALASPARADVLVASVSGPTALAPGAVGAYNASVTGGSPGLQYEFMWYLKGSNLTGGAPVSTSPGRLDTNKTFAHFNITAPKAQGTVTIYVTVTSKATATSPPSNTSASLDVTVITPIVLSASFRNNSPTAALNVTVRFYVDGVFAGSSVIKRIAPNSNATATFNYLPVGLSSGQHTVRAEADLGGTQAVTYTLFYKDVTPPSTGLSVLLGIGAFVPAFLVTVALRRRNK